MYMGSEICPMLLIRVCPKSVFQFVLKCQKLISLVESPVPVQKKKKVTFFFLSSEVPKNGQSKFTLRAKHRLL